MSGSCEKKMKKCSISSPSSEKASEQTFTTLTHFSFFPQSGRRLSGPLDAWFQNVATETKVLMELHDSFSFAEKKSFSFCRSYKFFDELLSSCFFQIFDPFAINDCLLCII